MCGQVGLVMGLSKRTREELTHLTGLFTNVLELSEKRGRHATGVSLVKSGGASRLCKKAIPASEFVREDKYRDILDSLDDSTTVLMGHTRWATVGDPDDPANAHPIRAGVVVGTANGTVINADRLFRRFKLPRRAEVDSEVIFRLADEAVGPDGRINVHSLAQRLAMCKGSLSAVMVAKTDPGRVVMVKGNKPLEMMYSARYGVVLYASNMDYIKSVVGSESGWAEMTIPRNALVGVDTCSLEIAEIAPVGWRRNSTLCST